MGIKPWGAIEQCAHLDEPHDVVGRHHGVVELTPEHHADRDGDHNPHGEDLGLWQSLVGRLLQLHHPPLFGCNDGIDPSEPSASNWLTEELTWRTPRRTRKLFLIGPRHRATRSRPGERA